MRQHWLAFAIGTIAATALPGCGESGGPSVPADYKPSGKMDPGLSSPDAGTGPAAPASTTKATPNVMDVTAKPQ